MSEITFQPLGKPVIAGKGLEEIADIDPRLTRTNYFDGRLLTAEDLTRDQIYLDQRLREVGRIMGSGIMSGLELSLNVFTSRLRLQKGRALTPAGRVLELNRELVVNLGSRAKIATLNKGHYRRFNRGLYAVVLRYADVGTDIAEVFPKDLGSKRGFQYALITEAVQMGLVPLPVHLPQQNALRIRARLIRQMLDSSRVETWIPEDAIPLGVLAIKNDRPQWLDAELLRHPVRNEQSVGDLQADLARQYQTLFEDVLSTRQDGSMNGDFAARDYFSILPPVGPLPKDAIDPAAGRQGFFPENFQVHIAPIRKSDIPLIKKESMGLPAIDLRLKEPLDIVVLAPLGNQVYGDFATRLERTSSVTPRRLPQLDLLKLKLYPTRPVHSLDLDADVWQSIWQRVEEEDLFYLRRPTRAAETAISGIVLALGTNLPAPETPVESPADSGDLFENEDDVLLRRVNFDQLALQRPTTEQEGTEAVTALNNEFPNNAQTVLAAMRILLRIEPRYDDITWQTLLALARLDALEPFAQALLDEADDAVPTGERVATIGAGMGLAAELLNTWRSLDP